MKRLLLAWGGTVFGTVFGFTNAIIVTREWAIEDAADFFLVPAIMISLATIADLGQGVLSVHDVARLHDDESERQAYVNTVLSFAMRRGSVAGIAALVLAATWVQLSVPLAVAVGVTTLLTTLAIAGQPLLRGLDRLVIAPVGGAVGATIATGLFLIPIWLLRPGTAAVIATFCGYSLTGLVTVSLLARRSGRALADRTLIGFRRSRFAAGHNIANLAGRQVDTLIAGALLSAPLFTSYSVTTRLAAPLGLIAYAANQAIASDMHRIVDGDERAAADARRLHRWASVAAVAAGIIIVAIGPAVGDRVFGDSIEIRPEILALIVIGYVISVLAGSSAMLLSAADRTDHVLRAGVWGLCAAGVVAVVLVLSDALEWVAPAFLATWLTVTTVLSAEFARRQVGVTTWFFNLGERVEP